MSTRTVRHLESRAGVLVLILIPAAGWPAALAVLFADRLRSLLVAPPSP